MIEKRIYDLSFFTFSNLNNHKDLIHFVTTRHGGQSSGLYSSLNLSTNVGDGIENVTFNRKKLAVAFGVENEKLLFPEQCHTNHVKEVGPETSIADLNETDALITQTKGVCLCVLAADCVPVLLFDPKEKVIAVIHAGWRGTVGRIVPRTIERMVKSYSTKPENIVAAIGPSISQNNYEVGDKVANDFKIFFRDNSSIFIKNSKSGKYHIDLKQANKELLIRYGVKKENLEVSQACTYDLQKFFFSARRDGINSGRFGSGIMLL